MACAIRNTGSGYTTYHCIQHCSSMLQCGWMHHRIPRAPVGKACLQSHHDTCPTLAESQPQRPSSPNFRLLTKLCGYCGCYRQKVEKDGDLMGIRSVLRNLYKWQLHINECHYYSCTTYSDRSSRFMGGSGIGTHATTSPTHHPYSALVAASSHPYTLPLGTPCACASAQNASAVLYTQQCVNTTCPTCVGGYLWSMLTRWCQSSTSHTTCASSRGTPSTTSPSVA